MNTYACKSIHYGTNRGLPAQRLKLRYLIPWALSKGNQRGG